MEQGKLTMKIGEGIGEILLDIAQNNIKEGNVEKAVSTYMDSLMGFTKEYVMSVLKNEMVLLADDDGMGVHLTKNKKELKKNSQNIFNWNSIVKNKLEFMVSIKDGINEITNNFHHVYPRDINDYSILDMMKAKGSKDSIHTIAIRLIGSENCHIDCDKLSNPQDIWDKFETKFEYDKEYETFDDIEEESYEKILYLTVAYHKQIRLLYKEFMSFEKMYCFLEENGFIERPNMIEKHIEEFFDYFNEFIDPNKGYYHPLCNSSLYELKEKIHDNLLTTKYGKEYFRNGILQKNILDGYNAGWLSPEGEFYGDKGPIGDMIHMAIAERIFKGNNVYANRMSKDGVSEWGASNSPEHWLEKHGWVKIHDDDCYGAFLGLRNEEPTPDFPYAYNPTEIQIKMICDYADKFYGGKFYTEANALGRVTHTEPYSTYKVRQMDDIMIHKIFGR